MESNDQSKYDRAKRRVEAERGFYAHLTTYVLCNSFLIFVWWWGGSGYHWYIWPLLGWGLGLSSHWFSVFGGNLILGSNWEEKRIKQLMDKDDN